MSTDRVLAAIDGAIEDWECGPDASGWQAGGGPDRLLPSPAGGFTSAYEGFAAWSDAYVAVMAPIARAWADAAVADFLHAAMDSCEPVRCRRCNPRGNPEPLVINGMAYRERQRARKRRR